MATVYLAEDLKHHRRVAMKVLKPELGAVLGGERFLSEIKVTANLQHPNLLPLFDSGAADGLLYYVMPYVDGETLRAGRSRGVCGRPGAQYRSPWTSPSIGQSPSRRPTGSRAAGSLRARSSPAPRSSGCLPV